MFQFKKKVMEHEKLFHAPLLKKKGIIDLPLDVVKAMVFETVKIFGMEHLRQSSP